MTTDIAPGAAPAPTAGGRCISRSRRGILQRTCDGHAADRLLVRGTGTPRRARQHGHPLVRGGRRSDILPDADLLLGNRGSRMFPRGQRHDAQIFAHVAFWLFNRVTNFAYLRYDLIAADIRKVVDEWENTRLEEVKQIDAATEATRPRNGRNGLPVIRWIWPGNSSTAGPELDRYLLVK